MELAAALARGPREAIAAAKRVIDVGLQLPLDQGLTAEAQAFASLFGTADQATGMQSFIANGPGKAEFAKE
jgi:enoyl-CoA hydratase/carnithine racemase